MVTRLLTVSSILGVVIFATWSFWRPMSVNSFTVRLPGTVEIHEVRLGSKVGGRVKAVLVQEGETVHAGQHLVEFDIPELRAQRAQLEAQIYGAEARLMKCKVGARVEEKQAAHASVRAATARRKILEQGPRQQEIEQARGEMESVAAQLEQAKLHLARLVPLASNGASTTEDVEVARANQGRLLGLMNAARAHLQLLEVGTRPEELQEAHAELARVTANAALLDAGSRPEDVQEAVALVAEIRAKLQELDSQMAESIVKSPATAIVEVLAVRPGDIVEGSQSVVRVLEPEELWVKAYVSEIDLAKVQSKQPVTVTIDAYPGRHFEGTITFIANDSEFTPHNVQTLNERRHLVFGIKVKVQDPERIFKSGMAADVWISTK